jgi:hypothetical protein
MNLLTPFLCLFGLLQPPMFLLLFWADAQEQKDFPFRTIFFGSALLAVMLAAFLASGIFLLKNL